MTAGGRAGHSAAQARVYRYYTGDFVAQPSADVEVVAVVDGSLGGALIEFAGDRADDRAAVSREAMSDVDGLRDRLVAELSVRRDHLRRERAALRDRPLSDLAPPQGHVGAGDRAA